MRPSSEAVRLHELRQLLFGELSEEAASDVRRRLAADARAMDRMRRLVEEHEAHAAEPMDAVVDAVMARLERPRRPGLGEALGGLTVSRPLGWLAAAAAVTAVVWLPFGGGLDERDRGRASPGAGERVRPKGVAGQGPSAPSDEAPSTALDDGPALRACAGARCPQLEMFVKDAGGIRPASDGVRLQAGDWIQFRYRARGRAFVFVVSVDDDGVLSPLYPDRPGVSVPIEPSGRHVLAGSVILDDAVGPERFYAFFSDEPLAYETLARALKTVRDPVRQARVAGLAASVDQVSVLIYKEAP